MAVHAGNWGAGAGRGVRGAAGLCGAAGVRAGGALALSCGCCGGYLQPKCCTWTAWCCEGVATRVHDALARACCGEGGWRLERGRCGGLRGAVRASTVCPAWVAALTWEHVVLHAARVPVVKRLSLHGDGAGGRSSPARSGPRGTVSTRGEPTGGPGSLVRAGRSVQCARVHRGLPSPGGAVGAQSLAGTRVLLLRGGASRHG